MEKLQLNGSLCELTRMEAQEVYGGEVPSWLKGISALWLIEQVIDNWDEIKQGVKDGAAYVK